MAAVAADPQIAGHSLAAEAMQSKHGRNAVPGMEETSQTHHFSPLLNEGTHGLLAHLFCSRRRRAVGDRLLFLDRLLTGG